MFQLHLEKSSQREAAMNSYDNSDHDENDEIYTHVNNCSPVKCLRCIHADMLQVERSYSCVRCGCPDGKNRGTWAHHYMSHNPPEECVEFCEVTDERRKRMMNLAWELSCDRKKQWLRACDESGFPENSRPVCIAECTPHFGIPFPELERKTEDKG